MRLESSSPVIMFFFFAFFLEHREIAVGNDIPSEYKREIG